MPAKRMKSNAHRKVGRFVYIALNGSSTGEVKIDARDLTRVLALGSWNRNAKGQVSCQPIGKRGAKVYLHRLIANAGIDQNVDFLDGDQTNFTRKNLILIPVARNRWGSQSGVTRLPSGRYRAFPSINGTRVSLGTFDTLEEAVQAVKNAAPRETKGVFFDRFEGYWRCYAGSVYLGKFDTESEAIQRRKDFETGKYVKPAKTHGIYFDKQHDKWRATGRDGKYLGRFATKDLAVEAQNVYHQGLE